MRRLTIFLLAAVMAAVVAPAAADTVYRWTDENGVTHYSDTAPEGRRSERVQVRGGVRAEVAAEEPAVATANENCTRARANIGTLEKSPVVRMDIDGDGVGEELTAEQREAQLEIARRQAQAYCPPEQ